MKILLVDDSKSARYALRLELQRHGVEVATADSAEAAFEILKNELPDAILMDHVMPGLNGFEALDIIRADPRTARVPVIICTSNEDADYAATARLRGADGILPKSSATEKLPAVLEQLHGGGGTPTPAASSGAAVTTGGASSADLQSDLSRLIEERVGVLIEDRIEARLTGLLEPLLRDLERGLAERLTAVARQLVDSRAADLRDTFEQRLGAERESAAAAQSERIAAALASGIAPAVGALLPPLLREEVETERAQVLGLVDQYLREATAREAAAANRLDARMGELDGLIAAKAREIVRREVADNTVNALQRTRQSGDELLRELRSRLTMIYLSILGAALIGILAAAAVYILMH